MLGSEAAERHRRGRTFEGRVAELQCADWLETQSYQIVNLEALGGAVDIEAVSPDGSPTAFEVKFIGIQDADFSMIQRSLEGDAEPYTVSPYTAINYLLFRAYEAAKQLSALPVYLATPRGPLWRFNLAHPLSH